MGTGQAEDQEKKDMRALIGGIHCCASRPQPDTVGMYCQMMAMADECEIVIPELRELRPPPYAFVPARQVGIGVFWSAVVVALVIGVLIGVFLSGSYG